MLWKAILKQKVMEKEYLLEYDYSTDNRDGFKECDRVIRAQDDSEALERAKDILGRVKSKFKIGERFIDAELIDDAGSRVYYWNYKNLSKL